MASNNPAATIPALVKHVTMRIYAKDFSYTHPPGPWVPKTIGKDEERFIVALQMAINELTRQGYVGRGSTSDPAGFISMTGKGLQRTMQHDKDNPSATALFDSMYERAFIENPMEAGRDETTRRGEGPGPKRAHDSGHQSQSGRSAKQHEAEKELLSQYKKDRNLSFKSAATRAKRAVTSWVKRITRRRPPKGRV